MMRRTSMAAAVALVLLAACGKEEKTAATIAEDSALARDIAMAGMDSLAEPMMTDLSTGTSAEPAAAPPSVDAATPRVAAEPVPDRKREGSVASPSRATSPTRDAGRTSSSRSGAPAARPPARTPAVSPRPATAEASPPPLSPAPDPAPRAGGGRVIVPPASASRSGMIAAGSSLPLNAATKVCTNTNRVGQTFNATVASAVGNSSGGEIPAGAAAVVEITELTRASDDGEPIRMGFRVTSVSFGGKTYPVNATATSASIARVRKRTSRQAEKIAGGAAVGAIAGQVLGKNTKSTVTGAAVGAAIGAAAGAAASSPSSDGCVPSGGRINTVLNSPLRV